MGQPPFVGGKQTEPLSDWSAAKESNGATAAAESDEMTLPAVAKTRESPWPEGQSMAFSDLL
jgi:hypothetical protein